MGDIVLVRNIQPEFVKRRQYWSLARVLSVIKGHDGKIRSATVLKGTADYLKRKREPEVHPVSHLYPLELSITHDFKSPLPEDERLPDDVDPELVYRNYDELSEESFFEELESQSTDNADTSLQAVEEPELVDSTIPSDSVNSETSEVIPSDPVDPVASGDSNTAVRFSRRGRPIIPKKGNEDFISY